MRFVLSTILFLALLVGCTLRVGTVEPSHPDYNRPGVVVGRFEVQETEYRGPRYAVMTCTTESMLHRQLDRVMPVRAITRRAEREIRGNQISHLTGWGCNERIVRGYPTLDRVGRYTSLNGETFGICAVWQRDGRRNPRAFNFGFTSC